jgi:hypothetical protein
VRSAAVAQARWVEEYTSGANGRSNTPVHMHARKLGGWSGFHAEDGNQCDQALVADTGPECQLRPTHQSCLTQSPFGPSGADAPFGFSMAESPLAAREPRVRKQSFAGGLVSSRPPPPPPPPPPAHWPILRPSFGYWSKVIWRHIPSQLVQSAIERRPSHRREYISASGSQTGRPAAARTRRIHPPIPGR